MFFWNAEGLGMGLRGEGKGRGRGGDGIAWGGEGEGAVKLSFIFQKTWAEPGNLS